MGLGGALVTTNAHFRAAEQNALSHVSGIVHDSWIHLDKISFNEQTKILVIPFGAGKPTRKWRFKFETQPDKYPNRLSIHDVMEFSVRETEGVVVNTINDVFFDAETHAVKIVASPACEIHARVSRIDVEVDFED
jgi:hypothetical protein